MNKYELAVVVNAKIEDDARTATIEKVKELIARFHFESDATVPAEMEARLRIMDNVLRYLCVRQEA